MKHIPVAGDDNVEILTSSGQGKPALELTRSFPAPTNVTAEDSSRQSIDEIKSYTSETSWRTRRERLNL
jgi:hypothetical protein